MPARVSDVAVEQLKECLPSPPVPTMSMHFSGTPGTFTARESMMRMAAASSEGFSPFIRRPMSRAPACAGVMVPSSMEPKATSASSSVRSRPRDTDSRMELMVGAACTVGRRLPGKFSRRRRPSGVSMDSG